MHPRTPFATQVCGTVAFRRGYNPLVLYTIYSVQEPGVTYFSCYMQLMIYVCHALVLYVATPPCLLTMSSPLCHMPFTHHSTVAFMLPGSLPSHMTPCCMPSSLGPRL